MGAQIDVRRKAPQDHRQPAREDPLRGVDPPDARSCLGPPLSCSVPRFGKIDEIARAIEHALDTHTPIAGDDAEEAAA
jgi:hypothetical protein